MTWSSPVHRITRRAPCTPRPKPWSFLVAASQIEAARAEERAAARPGFADARIGDRFVLELTRLDAPELLELLGDDRDRGPDLDRRADRLVQAAPEPGQRALVESRRHDHVEPEVFLERVALELLAPQLGILHDEADDEAEQQLLVLGSLRPCRQQIIEPDPQPAAAEELLDRAVVLRNLDDLAVRRRVGALGIDRQLIEVDRDRREFALDRVGLRRLLDDVDALVAVALELVLQQTRQRLRRLLDDVMLRRHRDTPPTPLWTGREMLAAMATRSRANEEKRTASPSTR